MTLRATLANWKANWGRRLLMAVAALLVLWLLAWAALPPLLRSQGEQRLTALLGRPVQIERVDVRPWSLTLAVDGLRIGPAPGAASPEPQLTVQRIVANFAWSSLWRLAPVIEELQVDAPVARLARVAEGRYDIDDILARLQSPPGTPPSKEPARFALYNLQLREGALHFDDRPVARKHELSGMLLTAPFLSDLPSQVDIKVEPRLAFTLDGTRFDSGAQGTPFAHNRATSVQIKTGEIDLAPWRPYLPRELPIDVQRGRLQAALEVRFSVRDDGTPVVSLHGDVQARDWALSDRAGAPLASWRALQVPLADVQPLTHRLALGAVKFDGLAIHLVRNARGALNAAQLGAAEANKPAAQAPAASAGAPWQVALQSLELTDGTLRWQDAGTQPAATLSLAAIQARAGPITWPSKVAAPITLSAQLRDAQDAAAGTLQLQGQASEREAQLTLQSEALPLAAFAPFAAQALKPRMAGLATLQLGLDWAADPARLVVTIPSAHIDELALTDTAARPDKSHPQALAWQQLAVADTRIDLLQRQVALGKLTLAKPHLSAERDAQGQLNLLAWMSPSSPAPAAASPAGAASSPAWRVHVGEATLSDGQLRWRDARPAAAGTTAPVKLDVRALQLALRNFDWPAGAPAELKLAAQVIDGAAARGTRGGTIDWNGRFGTQPLALQGALRVERFPLQALEPYVGAGLNVSVLRAEAGWRGDLALRMLPAGLEASARGNAFLGDLHVNGRNATTGAPTDDELLSWRALALRRVVLALAPRGAPKVEIGEAVVSDFYSRLVVDEQGRFNLRDVTAPADAASAPPGGFAVTPPAHAASATAMAASAPPAASASAPALALSVGGLKLVNGRIDFSDHFVRPNYSAALSELNGTLGAFRSDTREMAPLELRGKMAGTADLEIRGSLNPSADPLALDITAKASDLELAPLSPYAGKYAGYAIERGKLSMDVHYNVQADGRLDASNHVVLNQLTFGDRIESPDATKLPVRLAVALLKDRNGVIDINLPVNGSLHDPQFSVAGIVVKIIVNLLVKAVTAPFSLIAGLAGGGSEDPSVVEFRPGTAQIADSGRGGLEHVAKALADRPALKMTVTGAADAVSEREAMQAAQLEQRLQAERRRELLRAGGASAAAGAASAPLALSGDERARLVKALYSATDIPGKPRNFIGFAKDIPLPEMEALLRSRITVNDDSARELALQRGIAVRDALVAHGLASERLFLAAPQLHAAEAAASAPWSPRVQLVLSAQ